MKTAQSEYDATILEVIGEAHEIIDEIHGNMPAPESDGINWENVGTAKELLARLKAIRAFVRNEEQ